MSEHGDKGFVLKAVFSVVLASSVVAAEKYPVDWNKAGIETSEHFLSLLRIDTSNPPGRETRAASYIQKVLEREGIPARLFSLEPDRANLVARIRGNGSKRPLLVMGHTDVVGVQREKWTVDPFAGVRKGGYIYGRGAQDDKDNLTAGLMLMLLLKRSKVRLDRDVIFLAEAGEEASSRVGIDFMVERYWKEIEAEYALAEGGYTSARNGKVRFVEITTTEKVPRGVRLVARGTAGHGSRPTQDNPVVHLARAVAKFADWQPPMRLNDTTRAYFERLATISSAEDAARFNGILDPRKAPEVERYFARYRPSYYSILRTSVAPTIIKAGFRSNVIPSEAEAYLDVRALPDEDMDRFHAELRRVIGDPSVEIEPPARAGRPASPPSRLDTDMFRAIEHVTRRMFPGAIVLPSMLTGATDMAQLRVRGVQAYGYGPIIEEKDEDVGGAHSDDERLQESSLHRLVEFLWRTVLEVAAK